MNPVVGLLPWLGINPHPSAAPELHLGPPVGGRDGRLAVRRAVVHHHVGRPAVGARGGARGRPGRRRLELDRSSGGSPCRCSPPPSSSRWWSATIYAFQTFGQIDILIGYQNAAYEHVNVLIYNIYTTLVYSENPGRAAVMSIVLFLITLVPHAAPAALPRAAGALWPLDAEPPAVPPTAVAWPQPAAGRRRTFGRRGRLVGRYLLLIVGAVVILFPLYMTVVNSLLLRPRSRSPAAARSSRSTRTGAPTPPPGPPATSASTCATRPSRP